MTYSPEIENAYRSYAEAQDEHMAKYAGDWPLQQTIRSPKMTRRMNKLVAMIKAEHGENWLRVIGSLCADEVERFRNDR